MFTLYRFSPAEDIALKVIVLGMTLSVKELWPSSCKHSSFILDILMSKSHFFSFKNSLNIFTKFPKVGVLYGLNRRTQSHTSNAGRVIFEAS